MTSMTRRVVGFTVVTTLCVGAVAWYSMLQAGRSRARAGAEVAAADPAGLRRVMSEPFVLFRNTALSLGYGRVAAAPLSDPNGARHVSELECDRVDFNGGTGVCLTADRGVLTTYKAVVFDALFNRQHEIPLAGAPSRVRVAPNGALAGITVFVSGHSYASTSFSTATTILDTRSGKVVSDLEQLEVTRNGQSFKAVDFNFWGVTFRPDSGGFFATLGTGGTFYLVEASAATRRATVVADGVECPALSPDGRRVAYKKRVTERGRFKWRLAVRSVDGGAEQVIAAETRSIDDQVEWLDNERILYGASDEEIGAGTTSVWMVPASGGPAQLWLSNGFSPAVPNPSEPVR